MHLALKAGELKDESVRIGSLSGHSYFIRSYSRSSFPDATHVLRREHLIIRALRGAEHSGSPSGREPTLDSTPHGGTLNT